MTAETTLLDLIFMKSKPSIFSYFLAMSGCGMALVTVAHAQSGTWTSTASGNWSNTANWDAAVVADGASNTANFNSIDIPAGALTVTVDSARSISGMSFGDTEASTAGTWSLAMGANLTLASSTEVSTHVATVFTGNFATQAATDQIVKKGVGQLNLSGTGNAWAGTMNIEAGSVRFKGNTTSTATVVGALTGSGEVFVQQSSGNTFTQLSDISGFSGTIKVQSGNLRYSSGGSAPTAGQANGSQVTFDLGSGGNIVYRNATNGTLGIRLGALTGSAGSFVSGGNLAGSGTVMFTVGEKNISTTFGGVIRDGLTKSGLTKSGSASLTLSGSNTYTGSTSVSAGSLLVTGALGNTAVNVGANGTIGGSGALGGDLTISAGGNLDVTGGNLSTGVGLLTVDATKTIALNGFSFADIVGWDAAAAADGTYTLINGASSVTFGGATPTEASPFWFIADVKKGYFKQGSLQAVIVTVPETSAAMLGSFGGLLLLRRRRA